MDELDSHAAGAPPRQQRGAKKRSHRRDEDRTEVKATAAKSSDEDDEVKLKAVALLARRSRKAESIEAVSKKFSSVLCLLGWP